MKYRTNDPDVSSSFQSWVSTIQSDELTSDVFVICNLWLKNTLQEKQDGIECGHQNTMFFFFCLFVTFCYWHAARCRTANVIINIPCITYAATSTREYNSSIIGHAAISTDSSAVIHDTRSHSKQHAAAEGGGGGVVGWSIAGSDKRKN